MTEQSIENNQSQSQQDYDEQNEDRHILFNQFRMKKMKREEIEQSKSSIMLQRSDFTEDGKVKSKTEVFKILFDQKYLDEYHYKYKFTCLFFKQKGKNIVDKILNEKQFTLNEYGLYYNNLYDPTLDGLQDMLRLDELVTESEIRNMYEERPEIESISGIKFEEVYLDNKAHWG